MTVAYGRTILRLRYGSHLFGTDTPSSDLDLKSIFVPNPRDILLGRVKGAISTKRQKAFGERSLAGEVEEESYSLQRFLALAAEGQTVALDILFAPSSVWVEQPAPEWLEVVANRHRLLTRRSAAFVGYCRQQANKYGIKGSRLEATRPPCSCSTKPSSAGGPASNCARSLPLYVLSRPERSFLT